MAIPSNGRLEKDSLEFFKACGLPVKRLNSRQYTATIPALPNVSAVWQRQNDIVRGIALGSLDFAIVGQDALEERSLGSIPSENILVIHDAMDVSHCELHLAVPQSWTDVQTMDDLKTKASQIESESGRSIRIATKYPNVTGRFLSENGIDHEIVKSDGTLEIAPAIGYADIISDLVSTGTTLRANQLRQLDDGLILHSQAVLIGNKKALQTRPAVLEVARELIEFFEAYLRAQNCYSVAVNMRGESPEAISRLMLDKPHIRGLQGPTIAPIVPHIQGTEGDTKWYAAQIVVKKKDMSAAIRELREIGGSGVIVTPVRYIFEEEPARYRAMLEALEIA